MFGCQNRNFYFCQVLIWLNLDGWIVNTPLGNPQVLSEIKNNPHCCSSHQQFCSCCIKNLKEPITTWHRDLSCWLVLCYPFAVFFLSGKGYCCLAALCSTFPHWCEKGTYSTAFFYLPFPLDPAELWNRKPWWVGCVSISGLLVPSSPHPRQTGSQTAEPKSCFSCFLSQAGRSNHICNVSVI